jgi:NADH:ubiquinone oxidoreductase subunit C
MEMKIIGLNDFRKQIEKLKDARLITISAIDTGENYQLLYHFDLNGIKTFKITISDKTPIIKTITDIFPSAEFYEREIHDFFGIEFEGNIRLHEKMFLPDNWSGQPPHKKIRNDLNA